MTQISADGPPFVVLSFGCCSLTRSRLDERLVADVEDVKLKCVELVNDLLKACECFRALCIVISPTPRRDLAPEALAEYRGLGLAYEQAAQQRGHYYVDVEKVLRLATVADDADATSPVNVAAVPPLSDFVWEEDGLHPTEASCGAVVGCCVGGYFQVWPPVTPLL